MTSPVVAQKKPYIVEVEAGKTYYWCSCGLKAGEAPGGRTNHTTGIEPIICAAFAARGPVAPTIFQT